MKIDRLEKRFPNGLTVDIQTDMEKFHALEADPHVKSVELMENFGKDIETSLYEGKDVYRGVIVETDAQYKLSSDDIFWFHPQLVKKRSMFSVSDTSVKYNSVKEGNGPNRIPLFNSSVGMYTTTSFDDLGAPISNGYVIVDTYAEAITNTQAKLWLESGLSMKEVYTQMQTLRIDGKTLEGHASALVDSLKGKVEKPLLQHSYNVILKSPGSYLFYNHALRPNVHGKVLQLVSPLMGYTEVTLASGITAVASDYLTTDKYVDVQSFNRQQTERAFVSSHWNGKNIVNSFALRKPFDSFREIIADQESSLFRMSTATFSSTPVVNRLPPETVLALTPEATNIPSEITNRLHKTTLQNVIRVPASQETLVTLMRDNWKQLVSSKYVGSGDTLCLPRHMVKLLTK
jgi:hypothetical protein